YSNRSGRPGTAIYQQAFTTQYPTYRNGFVEFKFSKSVSVRDTFYIGYQQISSSDTTYLRLGFDKNSPFGSQIFYNAGSNWDQNLASASLNVQGAFMLRPVMGAKPDTIVTAVPEPEPLAPLRTYPNPTTGLVRWDEPGLTRLDVMNNAGRVLLTLEPSRGQQTLDLSYLPDGLYLIRLVADKRSAVQKLIIQH
ncbi:MAG: T9SS type A sorting domain-containing protein, partial [Cytophagaceae bacterium]